MKQRIIYPAIALLFFASWLSACGQSTQPTIIPTAPAESSVVSTQINPNPTLANSNTGNKDACELLTKEDVSKVLSQPVDAATSTGMGGVCSYKSNTISIDLTITNTGGTKFMQQNRTKLAENAIDVPGLGDEAFYNSISYTLVFRKGDSAFLIFVVDSSQEMTDENRMATEKALGIQLATHIT